MKVFLLAHQNYNYDDLFLEIDNLYLHVDENFMLDSCQFALDFIT